MTSFLTNFLLLAQDDFPNGGGGAGVGGILAGGGMMMCCLVFSLLPALIVIAGMWKTFEKAGKPGWAAIVPIYNMYVVTEISGKEILWFILMLVPCVNIVALFVVSMDVAKNFGQGPGFGIGLALLPYIFYPILGFGSARYQPGPRM